jgi:HEAT repeat protein
MLGRVRTNWPKAVAHRQRIIRALIETGPIGHEAIAYALERSRDTAFDLGEIGDSRSVHMLMNALKSKRPYSEIHDALIKMKALSLEPLIKELENIEITDSNDQYASNISKVLCAIGDSKAATVLLRVFDHIFPKFEHKLTTGAIATVLADVGCSEAVEPLIRALQDKRCYARARIALALGKLGDERAIQPLITILHAKKEPDTFDDLQDASVEALARIGNIDTLDTLLSQNTRCPGNFDYDLALFGPPAVPYLIEAYENPHSTSAIKHFYVLHALLRIGDRRAVAPILKFLRNPRHKESDRISAASALGDFQEKAAAAPIRELLCSWEEKFRSCPSLSFATQWPGIDQGFENNLKLVSEALGKIGDPLAVELLARIATSDYPSHVLGNVVSAIESILETSIAEVKDEALTMCTKLEDRISSYYTHGDGTMDKHKLTLDFSKVRTYAREELNRRNLSSMLDQDS